MRSVVVLVMTSAVIVLDSGWSLAAVVVLGVVLFAMAYRAEHRHSPSQRLVVATRDGGQQREFVDAPSPR